MSKIFYPSTNHPWLESLISYAGARYGAEMTHSLQCLLSSPETSMEVRIGALTLAGYLGWGDLNTSIRLSWHFTDRSFDSVLTTIWAALRCSSDAASAGLLESVLSGIFEVSDEKRAGGWSDRNELYQELAFAGRHGYSDPVVAKLQELADSDERYADFVFRLFEEIDHPIALRFVIRRVAAAAAKQPMDGTRTGAFIWETQWRRGAEFEYRPMPEACLRALEQLWATGNPDWLRRFAFKQWIRFSGDALWAVRLPDDLSMTDEAVWQRALRGDGRIGGAVLQRLPAKPHWYQLLSYVWAPEFEPALDSALRAGNSWSVHILRDIPGPTAERLICSNWGSIRTQAEAIQAALYVGSARTHALAAGSLSDHSDASKMLAHVSSYFGFCEHGRRDRLSQRHLDALRPYLAILSSHCMFHMLDFCAKYGFRHWAVKELIPECRRRLAESADSLLSSAVLRWFPTDQELITELDCISEVNTSRWRSEIWFWTERFSERLDDPGRSTEVLRRWLVDGFSARKFEVAAMAVRYQGDRAALRMLAAFVYSDADARLTHYFRDAEYGVKRRSFS